MLNQHVPVTVISKIECMYPISNRAKNRSIITQGDCSRHGPTRVFTAHQLDNMEGRINAVSTEYLLMVTSLDALKLALPLQPTTPWTESLEKWPISHPDDPLLGKGSAASTFGIIEK
jgi:hypothetical protein